MSTEPLWRGKPDQLGWLSIDGRVVLDIPSDMEVALVEADSLPEVWPAGDRTPTREQVHEAIAEAITEHVWVRGSGEIDGDGVDKAADAVLALLHGQGDETDGG